MTKCNFSRPHRDIGGTPLHPTPRGFRALAVALAAAIFLPTSAAAQMTGEQSSSTTYVGYYGVSHGFNDRLVIGNFANLYIDRIGLHSDVAHIEREEAGTYGALGLSYALSDAVRVRGTIGSSTDNDSILPELLLRGSVQFKPGGGLILTPALTYRDYRAGGSSTSPELQVAKYFNMAGDDGGYWVAQANGGLSFNRADETGWTLGAGLTTVRNSGLTIGASLRAGRMAYDTILEQEVRSDIYGGSLSLGYRMGGGTEIYIRGDLADTEFYTVRGAMLGLKFRL
ncbi:hypothetical protein [Sphingomicrobium arenosum]|uniref:hypothetical protein n=1 Tax=Sphingomicrobium arenosum TaxID=2233861 RepID=UPI00223FB70B|nr:hypothetical protein [Sphingomicrobium arenosum]